MTSSLPAPVDPRPDDFEQALLGELALDDPRGAAEARRAIDLRLASVRLEDVLEQFEA